MHLGRDPSFYDPTPDRRSRDDVLLAYLDFLGTRNGTRDGEVTFDARDARMAALQVHTPAANTAIDPARFSKNYLKFDGTGLSMEELALLAFVKVNAGEAYGVEVTGAARAHLHSGDAPFARVERTLLREERYHTQLLVGATDHFEGVVVTDAWTPAWSLKILIGCLARAPASAFHPLLLGSELAGVFQFNWMLQRLHTLFPDDPAVRASMEERLMEILIDEVGHVAFNRAVVGSIGLAAARWTGGAVIAGAPSMVPELPALGFSTWERSQFSLFDYRDLPEQVRQHAFFA